MAKATVDFGKFTCTLEGSDDFIRDACQDFTGHLCDLEEPVGPVVMAAAKVAESAPNEAKGTPEKVVSECKDATKPIDVKKLLENPAISALPPNYQKIYAAMLERAKVAQESGSVDENGRPYFTTTVRGLLDLPDVNRNYIYYAIRVLTGIRPQLVERRKDGACASRESTFFVEVDPEKVLRNDVEAAMRENVERIFDAKGLLENPTISELSLNCQKVYAAMLERAKAARESGSVDEKGRPYFVSTSIELSEAIGVSRGCVDNAIQTLLLLRPQLIERRKAGRSPHKYAKHTFHVEIDLEKVLRREPNRRIVSTALELEKLRTQFSLGALADLPEKAKSIYALMLDLSEEAIERNVRDFGGQPYFYLTYVRVFELLGISSSKAIVNAIRDLEQRGLILRKQGSACEGKRIYLIDFTDITDTGDSAHEPDAVGSADADAIRKLRKSLENAPLVYLSEDVKQLCRLLLEREEVALDAGQVDETGQAYVLYNGKDIAEALSWSVSKAKKNLRVVSQCGLNIFKRELVGDGVTEKVVLGQLALRI